MPVGSLSQTTVSPSRRRNRASAVQQQSHERMGFDARVHRRTEHGDDEIAEIGEARRVKSVATIGAERRYRCLWPAPAGLARRLPIRSSRASRCGFGRGSAAPA
jgi:hypothetical protein